MESQNELRASKWRPNCAQGVQMAAKCVTSLSRTHVRAAPGQHDFCAQAWCASSFFVRSLFSTPSKIDFRRENRVFFNTFLCPSWPHAAHGGPPMTPGSLQTRVIYDVFCIFLKKPSPLSSKMLICGLAGPHRSKK